MGVPPLCSAVARLALEPEHQTVTEHEIAPPEFANRLGGIENRRSATSPAHTSLPGAIMTFSQRTFLSWLLLFFLTTPFSPPRCAADEQRLSPAIRRIIEAPRFKHAHWGILVVDLKSGETLHQLNADHLFAPASTTKLYSVAAALDRLGADFRFQTPIYRQGDVDASGRLKGNLILVASGDLTMGGRTGESGEIEFTDHDHTYADGDSRTQLTKANPLAGLDALAAQLAHAGIKRVDGEVVVDARLFDPADSTGSGPRQLTPVLVNDNLIDITITPSTEGSSALVDWRPQASFLKLDAHVATVHGGEPRIDVSRHDGVVLVRGTIPARHRPVIHVQEVSDPVRWARGLFIEALQRAGVEVSARSDQPNPDHLLPEKLAYERLERVAVLESPPFSENARLILKVSHNLHASTLPLLVAVQSGKRTLGDGLRLQGKFLKEAGIRVDEISFAGAAGGANADFTTPRVTVDLLRYMATRPDFAVYERALPILGVDGTLADAVAKDSPARGNVRAKTGTLYWYNAMNDGYLLTSKALAGYLDAKSGRRLAFSFVVNGVHLKRLEERNEIGKILGQLCEAIYVSQ